MSVEYRVYIVWCIQLISLQWSDITQTVRTIQNIQGGYITIYRVLAYYHTRWLPDNIQGFCMICVCVCACVCVQQPHLVTINNNTSPGSVLLAESFTPPAQCQQSSIRRDTSYQSNTQDKEHNIANHDRISALKFKPLPL